MSALRGKWQRLDVEVKRAAFVISGIALTWYLTGAALWLGTGNAGLLVAAWLLTGGSAFIGGLAWIASRLFPDNAKPADRGRS